MSQHVGYRDLRRSEAENYARDFVPVIPAPLAADLIEVAAPEPGEFVVDVACGTGVVTHLAAERVGAAGKVVGIDLVPEMLAVADEARPDSGASIEWRQADAQALPLPDDSYDLVLCQLGLMFFPDRSAAVREMRRVLSPGGRIAVNVPGPIPRLFDVMAEALGRHIDPGLPGFLRAIFSVSESDLLTLLQDNDFHDVTVDTVTRTLRLPAPAQFLWQYLEVTPLASAVLAADADRRQALEDDVVAGWHEFVDGDGLVVELAVTTATARK